MSHTPGPWETHWSLDAQGYPTFYIHGFAGDDKRAGLVMDANARLIAAAPDLLATCKELRDALAAFLRAIDRAVTDTADAIIDEWVDELEALGIPDGIGVRADAAILKAEGR